MSVPYLLAFAAVLVIGVAIQRGNTCTLVAIDDIAARGSYARAEAIASTWLWVAGGLALVVLLGGAAPSYRAFAIGPATILGGLLLGIGALVNGACAVGTVARIGSGEWGYIATIAGFFGGSLVGPALPGDVATAHPTAGPVFTSLEIPAVAIALLGAIVAVSLRRLARAADRTPRGLLAAAWDPRLATALIGILFVGLVQAFGPWAYTDLLRDLATGGTDGIGPRIGLFVALLAGAVLAGQAIRGRRPAGYLPANVVRCFAGGLLMGVGNELVPGAYDGLTLFGQPLLLPHAWVAMLTCYLAIVVGIRARRRLAAPIVTEAPAPA